MINTKVSKRVLFSLFDQKDAVIYARQLHCLGWEVIATRETYDLFKKKNIVARDISDFLGIREKYPFPPTLHPSIELALTTRKGSTIDMVYVTNYPLMKGNDIGGHTILGLAAKGKRIVVFNKEDMAKVIQELKQNDNKISLSFQQQLINKAFIKIAMHYMSLIQTSKNTEFERIIVGEKAISLFEGENPYQADADLFRADDADALALSNFKQIKGVLPCYTNMADFDHILHILCLLVQTFYKYYKKTPYIVIAAKHGNPCGLAIDWNSPYKVIENALCGNPIAIFGGEVITNFPITGKCAKTLAYSNRRKRLLGNSRWILDLIIAPNFDQASIKILGKSKRLKLFKNKNLTHTFLSGLKWSYRMVRGGFLRQPPHNYILGLDKNMLRLNSVDSSQLDSLIIAWVTAWNSFHGGNEVAIAKNRMLLSTGGGPATIDSCYTAIERAKKLNHNLKNSVFAADAFFPFIDAPEELIKAGCIYGIVPKGGRNFALVKSYFEKHRIKVFYLPEQFRGFYGH